MFGPFRNTKLMPFVFLLAIVGFIYYTISSRNASYIQKKRKTRVLTIHPATYSLTTYLSQGTSITPEYVAIPRARDAQTAFLQENSQHLAKSFARASAVVSLRSLYPSDQLYAYARHSNINILEIDAAGYGGPKPKRVSAMMSPMTGQPVDSAWLSFARTTEMAEIIATDLARLTPVFRRQIQSNLVALKKQLETSQNGIVNAYSQINNLQVVATTDTFLYLTEEMNIFVSDYIPPTTPDFADKLTAACRANNIRVVLSGSALEPAIAETLKKKGIHPVVLDPILEMPDTDSKYYFQRLAENHSALLDTFKE